MKAVVQLEGNCEGYKLDVYLPNNLVDYHGFIDLSRLGEYDCVMHSTATQLCMVKIHRSPDGTAFIVAKATSIFAHPKFKTNVETKFIYDFNLFQWVGFGIVKLFRWFKRKSS